MSNADPAFRRKRVLVLTSTFPRWAGDREPPFVYELARRLAEEFDVTVLAPHAAGAMSREEIDGMQVHRFRYFLVRWQRLAYEGGILANLKKNPLNYLLVPFFILCEFIALVRLLRKIPIDAIHAHWLIPQGLVALAARPFSRTRPAIVCTSHGGDLFGLSGALFAAIKRQIIRRVDQMTVVSHSMRDFASALSGRTDIQVIPMGVDLRAQFTPPPAGVDRSRHEILFVGRLVEKKGARNLILAMPRIVQSHPNVQLLLAGDGPERESLQQLAAHVGVADHIQFLGSLDNAALPALYRRVALFAAPSVVARSGDQEGLGLVFVEALGCECPVVASDLPAIRDVVIDGVTGLICIQQDSDDLAQKVTTLLDNPFLCVELGRAGRQHVVARFDWQDVSQRYARLIQALPPAASI